MTPSRSASWAVGGLVSCPPPGSQPGLAQERVGVRVGLGVEQPVRITVTRQEALQPERIAAVPRPDQHDAALPVDDQPDAAQDERAHQDLGDVRLGGQHAAEVGTRHADDAAGDCGPSRHQDHAIVEQVDLAGELPVGVDGEHLRRAVHVMVEDLDRTLQHEEEIDRALATFEHDRTRRQLDLAAIACDATGHFIAQPREDLRLARIGIGRVDRIGIGGWGGRHGLRNSGLARPRQPAGAVALPAER